MIPSVIGKSARHTTRCTQRLLVTVGACFSSLCATSSYSQTRYQWQAVPKAAYYQGSYRFHRVTTTFRTTTSWLMLKPVANITIIAFDSSGHSLGPVRVSWTKPSAKDATTNLSRKPQDGQASSADWDPLTDDDVGSGSGAGNGSNGLLGLHKRPTRAYLRLDLGLGSETITAQGGIDSFQGTANIGSTELRGEWQPEDATWYLFGGVEAHNFQTVDSSNAQTGPKFLRATARTIIFYDLNPESRDSSGSSIGIGLGLAHSKMPVLGTTDQFSGSATLREQSSTGLVIAVNVALAVNPNHAFIGTASYQPPAFNSNPKALGAMADSAWRWSWDKAWFSDFGASWQWAKFTSDQSCAVATCQNFSQATSSLYLVHGGVGRKF